VYIQAVRLAYPKRPDSPAVARGAVEEGVVRRDRAVTVDAQYLAVQAIERLGGVRCGLVGYSIAYPYIEIAVGTEAQRPSVVAPVVPRVGSSMMTFSLLATATAPLAVKRLTRLWTVGLVAV
jgi:hypothetical protein